MAQLTIKLNGKTYTAPKPKTKLWRKLAKYQEMNNGKDLNEVLDETIELICAAFNNPEVTPEVIEEELDLEELMPTLQKVSEYLSSIIYDKSKLLPNSTTPTAE